MKAGAAKAKAAEHGGEEWCLKSWCVAPRALACSTVVAPLYASNLFQAFELSFFGLVCAKEMRRLPRLQSGAAGMRRGTNAKPP